MIAPWAALAGVVILIGLEIGLTLVIWPRLDELAQTLSRETGIVAIARRGLLQPQ